MDPALIAFLLAWLGKRAWNSDTVQGWRDNFGEKWDNRPISPNQGYYVPGRPSQNTAFGPGHPNLNEWLYNGPPGVEQGEAGGNTISTIDSENQGNNSGPRPEGIRKAQGGHWVTRKDENGNTVTEFVADGAMDGRLHALPPSWLHRAAPLQPDVTPGGVRYRGPLSQFDDTNDGAGLMVAPWRNDPGAGPTGPPGGGGEDPGGGGREPGGEDPWIITPTTLPNYTPLSGGPSWLAWQPGNTGTPAIVGPKED